MMPTDARYAVLRGAWAASERLCASTDDLLAGSALAAGGYIS